MVEILRQYNQTNYQVIENGKEMRKILQVTVITFSKFLSHNKAHKFFQIFKRFSNYAYFKSPILCGHFDTHIVDFKLF